ncbi:MAG: twin-arginine translocase subunit TatC [Chitinophagaceae bacterium]|nr:twin-arginine translocase subunit TatC [Chitinophagaceae bacterium]
MSFIDHLEELRWHIIRALIAVLVGALIVFAKIEFVVDQIFMGPVHKEFITYKWLCTLGKKIHVLDLCMENFNLRFQSNAMTEQFLMTFTIAFTAGFILAFPYVFWELWRFVRPALSSKEKRGTRGAIAWISILFFTGVLFGYYVLTPFMVYFYSTYTISPLIDFKPTISDYFENLVYLTVGIGLLFQLPVVVMLLTRVGILTPKTLKSIRKVAFVIILIAAAIITPSTDPFSLALVTIPLYALYEFSILMSMRIYKRQQMKEEAVDKEWE